MNKLEIWYFAQGTSLPPSHYVGMAREWGGGVHQSRGGMSVGAWHISGGWHISGMGFDFGPYLVYGQGGVWTDSLRHALPKNEHTPAPWPNGLAPYRVV